MDEDIEMTRKAIQDILNGGRTVAHRVTEVDTELSEEERDFQHDTVDGVYQLLKGLTDLGAVAAAAARKAERE